jgi:hypothetical protein
VWLSAFKLSVAVLLVEVQHWAITERVACRRDCFEYRNPSSVLREAEQQVGIQGDLASDLDKAGSSTARPRSRPYKLTGFRQGAINRSSALSFRHRKDDGTSRRVELIREAAVTLPNKVYSEVSVHRARQHRRPFFGPP